MVVALNYEFVPHYTSHPKVSREKKCLLLRDIFWLSCFAFGGSQAHLPIFLQRLVYRSKHLSAEELLELQALSQILPGPTSTQTLVALAYRKGGLWLAYLTLLIWCLPALVLMTAAALSLQYLSSLYSIDHISRFIQPMPVAFVAYAAVLLWRRLLRRPLARGIAPATALLAFYFTEPYLLPILLLAGGLLMSLYYRQYDQTDTKPLRIPLGYLLLWGGVLVAASLLTLFSEWRLGLLFESFYRNGSMIFGGGQILAPFLFIEFVEAKKYLSSQEFLSGFALMQGLPGPLFAFSAYVGGLSMREEGIWGQLLGSLVAAGGVFLPGTLLVFFACRFWHTLKRYRTVRAALEGVHAVSVGLLCTASVQLFLALSKEWPNYLVVAISLVLLFSGRVSPPWMVGIGLLLGFIY